MDSPDDIIGVLPIRPDDIDYDLGLGDNGLNRRVVPNVYYENLNFTTNLEFPLELL